MQLNNNLLCDTLDTLGFSILPSLKPNKEAKVLSAENKKMRKKITTAYEITSQNLLEVAKKILLEEFGIQGIFRSEFFSRRCRFFP